jgi:Tfp pilus assembly protein PilF
VRPEVGYVGDERCAECHHDIAEMYSKHPMSRTLTPIGRLAPAQSYDAALHNPFEAFGSRLQVEPVVAQSGDGATKGDHAVTGMRHRRTRLGADGRALFEDAMDVAYAIGSGIHGHSYLTDRDGYVFQTPISWFEQKQVWGLSPQFSLDWLTGRPVPATCLFCHANRARPVEGTYNRYEEPVFEGGGVGCERCHGPGERHVQDPHPDPMDHFDHTIVNPARLEPLLREAVCEQCHLEGAVRVLRRGRGVYDYRPGLPLEAFISVFIKTAAGGADRKAVNHVEQMQQSGCYRGGTGEDRIGCISCHDPHDYVGPERRVAYYREACLNCHELKQRGCSVPVEQRRRTSPDDSCIQCHMPPYAASDIVHNASTDHRIPRRPGQPDAPDDASGMQTLAILFHHDKVNTQDPEYRRDLGLALASMSEREDAPQGAAREADALLDDAVKRFPDDVRAWEAKGRRALLEGRPADALTAYESCLAQAPDREAALNGAAEAARLLGKADAGVDYWRRSVTVNPWSPVGRRGLAEMLAAREKWDEAQVQCREWLRQAPENIDARKLLIRCLLKVGDRAGAEAELKTLKGLRPGSDADLDFWFSRQQR